VGLRELIDTLERDAELELERRRTADAATAERIRTEAEAQAERIVAAAVAAAEDEAAARVRRDLVDARALAARELRHAREAALTAVHDAARDRLAGLRADPEYADLLSACLAEALAAVPEAERVHVDPRDAGRVSTLLDHRGDAIRVVADLTCWGGVVAAMPGRRVDNTLESRLQAAWPQLRSALATAWAAEERGGPDGPEAPP
jgi:vacuolar-type H+-ATPase subunit E/Vma4